MNKLTKMIATSVVVLGAAGMAFASSDSDSSSQSSTSSADAGAVTVNAGIESSGAITASDGSTVSQTVAGVATGQSQGGTSISSSLDLNIPIPAA